MKIMSTRVVPNPDLWKSSTIKEKDLKLLKGRLKDYRQKDILIEMRRNGKNISMTFLEHVINHPKDLLNDFQYNMGLFFITFSFIKLDK